MCANLQFPLFYCFHDTNVLIPLLTVQYFALVSDQNNGFLFFMLSTKGSITHRLKTIRDKTKWLKLDKKPDQTSQFR